MSSITSGENDPFVARALSGTAVWDIGQIGDATARKLNRLVKEGALLRCKGSWNGISPTKVLWCRPNVTFSLLERVVVVAGQVSA